MPTEKKSSKSDSKNSSKSAKDSTLSEQQASRVKGGRVRVGGGGTGNDDLIP